MGAATTRRRGRHVVKDDESLARSLARLLRAAATVVYEIRLDPLRNIGAVGVEMEYFSE